MTRVALVVAQPAHVSELAALRLQYAAEVDPHSTLETLPTAADLERAVASDLPALVAYRGNACVGYGLVHGWVEDDQTVVRLLDVWAVPGDQRAEAELFVELESALRQQATPADRFILGANSRNDEPERARMLTDLGYRLIFSMSELEWNGDHRPVPKLPPDVSVRAADPDDAGPVADLLSRAWSGRPYLDLPDQDQIGRWLGRAEPGLFLIAEEGTRMIGLASAVIDDRRAEIDDVAVDPARQRRGLGAALVAELLQRLDRRTDLPVRLHTESHDPAGALRLYRRLGFVEISRHHRWRKPATAA